MDDSIKIVKSEKKTSAEDPMFLGKKLDYNSGFELGYYDIEIDDTNSKTKEFTSALSEYQKSIRQGVLSTMDCVCNDCAQEIEAEKQRKSFMTIMLINYLFEELK
jgi:hypothetical protein